MPRRTRLVVPGIPRHIIQRGNNRSACFFLMMITLNILIHLKNKKISMIA